MVEKLQASAEDGATAALLSVAHLAATLVAKGALTPEEATESFANAAAACRQNGSETAALLVENIIPGSAKS